MTRPNLPQTPRHLNGCPRQVSGRNKAETEGRLDEKRKLYTVPRLLIVDEIGSSPGPLA